MPNLPQSTPHHRRTLCKTIMQNKNKYRCKDIALNDPFGHCIHKHTKIGSSTSLRKQNSAIPGLQRTQHTVQLNMAQFVRTGRVK